MTPGPYANFLVVSAGASAVLIGLLFVSVSVAPERVFGRRAEAGQHARALSSFTAFANVFFISIAGLIPNQPIGPVVVILGVLAASQTLSLLLLVKAWRRESTIIRGLTLVAVSGAVYGYEIVTGVRLSATPTNAGALTTLLQLLLGCYAIGLARAWELLGASHRSGVAANALGSLWALLGVLDSGEHEEPDAGPPPEAPPSNRAE
jgi:hypothetical protein